MEFKINGKFWKKTNKVIVKNDDVRLLGIKIIAEVSKV